MSIESVKSFIERMNTDGEFAKQIKEQSGREQFVAFLKSEGYEFSEEEYKSAKQALGTCELSDEQLETVSGGGMFAFVQDSRRK